MRKKHMSRAFKLSASAMVTLTVAGLTGSPTLANAATGQSVPVGVAPVTPKSAQLLGPAPKNVRLHLEVALAPQNPAALTAAVAAVTTPGSPDYRQYLPKGAFAAEFGPTPQTIAAVSASLVAAGLKPGPADSDGLDIPVTATVAQAEKAWGMTMDSYRLAGGATVYSNAQAPQMNSSVASSVQAVVGLDGFVQEQPGLDGQAGAAAGTAAPSPQSPTQPGAIPGQPTACSGAVDSNGWTAAEIAQAYDFNPLYLAGDFGQNQTIDVYELSPYEASDIATYQTCYGTSVPVSQVPVDGGQSSSSRPAGNGPLEVALDAEDVIGLDPDLSQVNIYDTANCNSCTDQYDEWKAISTNDDAHVVSTSWYGCEIGQTSFDDAVDTLFQKMAMDGQTVVGLTGDVGADNCSSGTPPVPYEAISFPSSSPNITAVGGTNLNSIGNPPAVPPSENAWVNGGGGISTVFDMPGYQNSIVNSQSSGTPCSNSGGYCRETPDVSADAGIGYAIYAGGWGHVGGTSASTPTWGALAALIDSSAPSCDIGFMNPTLYTLGQDQYGSSSGDYFNDVISGNNDVGGVGYTAGTGYDLVTGLGTPVGANLAQGFCPRTATTTVVTTSGSPSVAGDPVTFTATVSPTDNGGSVSFYADSSTTAISGCNQVLLTAGQAACTTSTLAIGSHTILAVYTGDTSGYLGSSGSVGQSVQGTTTTVTLAVPNPSVYPAPVTFTATVSPTDGGGTVSFYLDGSSTALCSDVALSLVSGSYEATCTDTSPYPLAGPHSIEAKYSGDTDYLSSFDSVPFTVNLALTAPPLPNPEWEMPYTTTITATGAAPGPVTFSELGTLPTGITLSPTGVLSGIATNKAQIGQTFTFTVTANGPDSATGSQVYSITLESPCGTGLTPYFLTASSHTGNFLGLFCVNGAGSGTYTQYSTSYVVEITGTGTVTSSGSSTRITAFGTNLALLGEQIGTFTTFTETAPGPEKGGTFTLA
jgi:subtilase family serine protease